MFFRECHHQFTRCVELHLPPETTSCGKVVLVLFEFQHCIDNFVFIVQLIKTVESSHAQTHMIPEEQCYC